MSNPIAANLRAWVYHDVRTSIDIAADVLDAIDGLHQTITEGNTTTYCTECGFVWPCDTHRLLHPAPSGEEAAAIADAEFDLRSSEADPAA